MLLAWAARAQALCAIGILLWLAAGLGFAARDGFAPARERYGDLPFSTKGVARGLQSMLPNGRGRVVFVADAAGAGQDGIAALEAVRTALAGQGSTLVDATYADLYERAAGADLICLASPPAAGGVLDWLRLAAAMQGAYVADFTSLADDGAADAAGLEVFAFGRPAWPAWLDPEFRQFVAHARATLPADAAILMVPGLPYRTAASRSRWFLLLNTELAPRRLHLWRPDLASGYVMQYFGWVEELNRVRPWQEARRIRPEQRALTQLLTSPSCPTRTLSSSEARAAEEIGAEWVLFFTPNPDFRLVDWELVPLAVARGWER